ncbi:MAG: arginine--tRNA ligase domain-containing protein [bacterium]
MTETSGNIFKSNLIFLIYIIIINKESVEIETDKNNINFNIKFDLDKINMLEIEKLIKLPPDPSYGDYCIPSYYLKQNGFKGSPEDIANRIVSFIYSYIINPLYDINKLENSYLQDLFKNFTQYFTSVSAKGAYINFYFNKQKFANYIITEILTKKNNYGRNYSGKDKTVVIDFSSPNIAKPFGVGHLRSTVIGMSLARIYDFCGYKTIKINYLGDFGTQFGKLITAFCRFKDIDINNNTKNEFNLNSNLAEFKNDPVKFLYKLYVKFHSEAETNPELDNEARIRFQKLEKSIIEIDDAAELLNDTSDDENNNNIINGNIYDFCKDMQDNNNNKDNRIINAESDNAELNIINNVNNNKKSNNIEYHDIKSNDKSNDKIKKEIPGELYLWKLFRKLSIQEFKRIYNIINVSFDFYEGESQSSKLAVNLVNILLKADIAEKSMDAVIIPMEKTPALIAKSDGTTLYLSRDIATAVLRFEKFKFDKMLYVVGSEQALHFSQLFNIFKILKENERKLIESEKLNMYENSDEDKSNINHIDKINKEINKEINDKRSNDININLNKKIDVNLFSKYASEIAGKLYHIKFGRIIGMSTRKGNLVFLEDYINEAKEKAQLKLSEDTKFKYNKQQRADVNTCDNSDNNCELTEKKIKNADNLDNKKDEKNLINININDAENQVFDVDIDEIALKVGIGAVVFNDLKTRRSIDINFNWDNVLSFEGQTGPYLQYSVARTNSLIEKLAKEYSFKINIEKLYYSEMFTDIDIEKKDFCTAQDDDFELIFSIVKHLSLLEDIVKDAVSNDEPSIVGSYLLDLAALFNSYYQNYKLMGLESDFVYNRILFLISVKIVLETGLNLLSVPILKKM